MTRFRPFSMAGRLAVLLMVIAMGGCDNVEWGGIKIAIVPPPPQADDNAGGEPASTLSDGPVLFYVHRDTTGPIAIPVGQITDQGLTRIEPGDDLDAFSRSFMDAFLPAGGQLALFRRGQRVGTLTMDGAALPVGPVCRPLPRATGTLDLASGAGGVTEFLALAADNAPESQPADGLQPARRMQVVSDMMAGEMLRGRDVAVANPGSARRQLQPFPLAGSADPGFTATYLVDDSLNVGEDDRGAALFVVFTPRGQAGYDTSFVGFTDYAAGGKAAPRVIDFLDWNGDGNVELLLEVFGTRNSWFRAVGIEDGEWRAVFQDRCDPRTAAQGLDTTVVASERESTPTPPAPRRTRSAPRPAAPQPSASEVLDSIPVIEPTIQLSNPTQLPNVNRATRDSTHRDTIPPDSGGGR